MKGSLIALGAGLASCADPQHLAEHSPTEPTQESTRSPTATERPELHAEASSTATVSDTPAPEFHEAQFYVQLEGKYVQCQMCWRGCTVPEGGRGFCRNKVNIDGRYYTLVYGLPSALQVDPIEKEPHYHMLPGGTIFCTGTASCNNRCKFCHNWHLSQRSVEEIGVISFSPRDTVRAAMVDDCDALSFTYNEPTVFYEHMFDVAKLAKDYGLGTLFHTNGGMREKPLATLLEHMDAVTVDLKAFNEEFYREVCSSELEPVLRTLQQIHESDTHLEIVNLVVTTLNDDKEDVRRMCQWIRDTLSDDVPIHFTRFFPNYKLTSLPATPIETLEEAVQIADEEGLKYVYIGNVPGHERNSTFCPDCGEIIIERVHFSVLSVEVIRGKCGHCGYDIPGIWWDA